LDGGQGHAKAGSDLAQGITSPDSFDDLAPSLTAVGFLLMAGSVTAQRYEVVPKGR
jgi:hypothetical protein